jgi:hypothetical protein
MISESQIITRDMKDPKTSRPVVFATNSGKRYKRIGLIKKKIADGSFRVGKWDMHEHKQFLKACLVHGNNWARVIF